MSSSSPSLIITRQDTFAVLELWLDREREAFPYLKERRSSPPTPIMPGAYTFKESMYSIQSSIKDQTVSKGTTSSAPISCANAEMVNLIFTKNDKDESCLRLPSTLKESASSSTSSPLSTVTTKTTSSKRRKSLGSEMGFNLFSSVNSNDFEEKHKFAEEDDMMDLDQSRDSFGSAPGLGEEIPLSPDNPGEMNLQSLAFEGGHADINGEEREIVIIEMDEDNEIDGPELNDRGIKTQSQMTGNVFKLVNNSSLNLIELQNNTMGNQVEEEQEGIEEINECENEQEYPDQNEFYAINGVHYLDPVEEVTEEPTMIEWTESEMDDDDEKQQEGNTHSSNSTPKLIRTFSPNPSQDNFEHKKNSKQLHEWAQLHGLATPSSFSGSPSRCSPSKAAFATKSRFGWAEVISKARYSDTFQKSTENENKFNPLKKIDKILGYANVASSTAKIAFSSSSPSVTFSPANVIGLRSSFWSSSPAKVTLDTCVTQINQNQQKQKLILSQSPPPRKSSMFNLLQIGVESMVQDQRMTNEKPKVEVFDPVSPSHSRSSMEPSGLPNESGWLDGATDSPIPIKPMRKPRWSNLIQDKLSKSRIPSNGSGSSKRTITDGH